MIYHVFANRSNIGDWLSAKGIQQLLRPRPFVELLCDENFVPQTLQQLAQVKPDDLVVIGGGGLFMDYFNPFWCGFSELLARVRYCIWGVGYCDLKATPSQPPLQLLRDVVGRSCLCVVRDELTRQYLQIDDLPPPVPCPSLLSVEPGSLGHGILHVDNYTTVGAGNFEVMHSVCQDFADTTMRPYRRTNHRIEADRVDELDRCLRLYRDSDLVVSSALHGCILAVAMGRPVLAVSGDRKIESFMAAAGLADWVLDHQKIADLPARIAMLECQATTSEFVRRSRHENRAVARRVLDLLDRPHIGGQQTA
ncbi:polysaccharide pyruvyl transferase family protein [Piscinibacter sakaiensis]|uniref:polysaccharide pyruvyl transferase family protein n=1 Tax=Piscinibacter sakaiensis TaxID=1547922 RepID=UPI003AAFB0B5